MKRIECLNFCQFIHDGHDDVNIINILSEWYSFCVMESCAWIIVVITQAAGMGGGRNIDIYKFNPDIEKEELYSLIMEKSINEIIITFNCTRESFEIFINEIVKFRG